MPGASRLLGASTLMPVAVCISTARVPPTPPCDKCRASTSMVVSATGDVPVSASVSVCRGRVYSLGFCIEVYVCMCMYFEAYVVLAISAKLGKNDCECICTSSLVSATCACLPGSRSLQRLD